MNQRCLILNSTNIKNIDFKRYSFIIGIEKGSISLIKNKIEAIHISDYDSITNTEKKLLKENSNKVIILSQDKIYTDLEEAIIFASKKFQYKDIDVIIETNSNRLDHINILTKIALKYPYIQIIFNNSLILSVGKGNNKIFTTGYITNKYFGIFANNGVTFSIKGSKYDVKDFVINNETSTQLVSNEVINNFIELDSTDTLALIFTDD